MSADAESGGQCMDWRRACSELKKTLMPPVLANAPAPPFAPGWPNCVTLQGATLTRACGSMADMHDTCAALPLYPCQWRVSSLAKGECAFALANLVAIAPAPCG